MPLRPQDNAEPCQHGTHIEQRCNLECPPLRQDPGLDRRSGREVFDELTELVASDVDGDEEGNNPGGDEAHLGVTGRSPPETVAPVVSTTWPSVAVVVAGSPVRP